MEIEGIKLVLKQELNPVVYLDSINKVNKIELMKDKTIKEIVYSTDEDDFFDNIFKLYNFEIIAFNEEDEEVEVGCVKTVLVNANRIDWDDFEYLLLLDSVSPDLGEFHSKVREDTNHFFQNNTMNKFLFIKNLWINKEYRNNGIGSSIFPLLRHFMLNVFNLNIKQYLLKAKPLDTDGKTEEEIEKDTERLLTFYKNLGFENIFPDNYLMFDLRNKKGNNKKTAV